jgi:carbon storage regulator
MLVLSRKERQRIKLGESIVVTVVRVSGDRVRLGIEAPSDVIVLREELGDELPAGALASKELVTAELATAELAAPEPQVVDAA